MIDEPADLPEGTEASVDDMPRDERAALFASLDRAMVELESGVQGIPAEQVLRELKVTR
ncbi:MAG: hypothetical protein IPF92_20620 [Myxococcales bacterium]|nr:hypothetical protein [Myxococcales bacterium]